MEFAEIIMAIIIEITTIIIAIATVIIVTLITITVAQIIEIAAVTTIVTAITEIMVGITMIEYSWMQKLHHLITEIQVHLEDVLEEEDASSLYCKL